MEDLNCVRYYTDALRRLVLGIIVSTSMFAQSALQQAVILTREKRYAEANKMLEGVNEPAQPNQRLAFHRLKAAIASGLRDNTAAAREMRAALAFAPNDPNLLLATSTAEFEANFLNDALQHARQAGDVPIAQALIGDIEEKRGHFVEAAKAYQAAVTLAPDREQYRIDAAFELIKHQAFQPAIDLLNQSIPLFPQSAKLRVLLGIASYAQGEVKDAETTFEDAIRLGPHLESAYRCLARIVLQSSAAPPQSVVDSLCAFDPIVCSALKLRAARETGNRAMEQQAIAGLRLAPPESAIGRCELARAYEWTGQLEDARIQMEECVRLDPVPQNHYRLGLLYKKLGLGDLARREMELRNQTLQKMSEQTALGLSALESSQSTLK